MKVASLAMKGQPGSARLSRGKIRHVKEPAEARAAARDKIASKDLAPDDAADAGLHRATGGCRGAIAAAKIARKIVLTDLIRARVEDTTKRGGSLVTCASHGNHARAVVTMSAVNAAQQAEAPIVP
jgi:hypothetical protein